MQINIKKLTQLSVDTKTYVVFVTEIQTILVNMVL